MWFYCTREWDERRSERSDRSGRRPRTPVDTHPPVVGSPFHGDNFSEGGSHAGTPHDYHEREVHDGREREREAREFEVREPRETSFEVREPHTVLPPLPAEDMEAISDDEDLPDLPPETGEVEEEYPTEDCMEVIGMDENNPDEGNLQTEFVHARYYILNKLCISCDSF